VMKASEDGWLRPASGAVLARSEADRATSGFVDSARTDPRTRVLVLRGDVAPLSAPDQLMWVTPGDVPDGADWALLGRGEDTGPLLLASLPANSAEPFASAEGWHSLRRVGGNLAEYDASALVAAVSLGRWLADAAFCPACGSATELREAGWSRRCPSCGRQHFPRTDPAVIVAVRSAVDPDRLLLGSNALWEENRYSCFAGFVEAGESAEAAVHRELREESGIRISSLHYRGSQAWPYPRSLMLGYIATAVDDADALADGDEIRTVRWFSRDEIRAGLDGEGGVILPGPSSISHALIRSWCEEAL
jgi:NAD+ diphosphatase